jgi:hypothetical protein
MSFTHRVVLPLAGIATALSMVTIGLAAEPAPAAPAVPTTPVALPSACQLHDDASTTKTPTTTTTATTTATVATTATPTPKITSNDDENDDDDDVEMKGNHGEAVRACIEALRADGHHGFGEIIRMIARAHAEGDDDDAPTATTTSTTTTTATVTGTPTATTNAEHHTRHTPPPAHHRD